MKKVIGIVLVLSLLVSSAMAIDGAMGLGKGKSKVELGYAGGSAGLAYDMGFSDDLTAYASLTSGAGVTGFGGGVKYAFINEKRGDSYSLAGKLDLLIGGGGIFPIPGLVVSKKSGGHTLLADFSTFSVAGASFTWVGFGAMIGLQKDMELSGMIGSSSVSYGGYSASGIGVGVGLNWIL
jgi:hypothetical protein